MEYYKFRIHPETCNNCLHSSKETKLMRDEIPKKANFKWLEVNGELDLVMIPETFPCRKCSLTGIFHDLSYHCENYIRCM